MILRLEIILSVMSYKRKNIIIYEKDLKLAKSNTFNNVFCNRIFLYYCFLSTFLKLLGFYKSWLIFSRELFSTTVLVLILKISGKILKYSLLKIFFNDYSHWKLHF